MTKVKPESQPTPITQAQLIDEPAIASESNAELPTSIVESTTKATSTRKPRAKTSSATKRQGINKTPSQSATTRVKLPPETTQVDDLAIQVKQLTEQVKHLREQVNREQVNREQVSESGTRPEESTSTSTQVPKRTRSLNPVQLPLESPRPPQTSVRPPQTSIPVQTSVRPPQTSVKSPQTSIPSFRPATSFPAARPRRRYPLHRIMQRSLRLPEQNSGIAIDAALWVFAAAGLRIGLKYLVMVVPILNFPVILLMFVPVLLAAYAALFIPKANRIGIYRLLLVSLGLFVGGGL